MKVKILLTFADDACNDLLDEFGLDSAEELKAALKIAFYEIKKEIAGEGGELKIEVEE